MDRTRDYGHGFPTRVLFEVRHLSKLMAASCARHVSKPSARHQAGVQDNDQRKVASSSCSRTRSEIALPNDNAVFLEWRACPVVPFVEVAWISGIPGNGCALLRCHGR